MNDHYIREQVRKIKVFLQDRYKINVNNYENIDSYFSVSLSSIFSTKIWLELTNQNEIFSLFLKEIISNANQILLLPLLGFKIPSYIMVRRNLEHFVVALYYKDHKIEFLTKEYDLHHKNYLRIAELKNYLERFPFEGYYSGVDCDQLRNIVKKLLKIWTELYQDLSNYVHGTSSKYLEITEFIDDIKFDSQFLKELEAIIARMTSIINAMNIIFWFQVYKTLHEDKKSLIRKSIENIGIKKEILAVLSEI